MESLLSKTDLLLRIFVMAGPLALLGLGLYYFLLPPKEANHRAGYRFRYGMSKVGVWRFMQNLAGIVYSGVGLALTVFMGILCIRFGAMEMEEMLRLSVSCILWELGIIAAATAAINLTVVVVYDSQGNNRREMRELFREE
jgi:uncharacterized membrane protein